MADQNRTLAKGELLFDRGDAADGMYVLRSGEIEVYLENREAKLSLAVIGPGAVVGEMALFDNKPRSACAVATKDSELQFISTELFNKALERCPKWFVNFLSVICNRLRNVNKRLIEIQDSYLFSIHQLRRWTELLHAVELIIQRSGQARGEGFSYPRQLLENELIDMFSLEVRKVSSFIDVLLEQKVIAVQIDSEKQAQVLLDPKRKTVPILRFLHEVGEEDKSRYCDLEQFGRFITLSLEKTPPQDEIINILKTDTSVEEISQAVVEVQKGECRRRHFRIFYKGEGHPRFDTDEGSYPVIDISELGLRFSRESHETFMRGQSLSGYLVFPSDNHQIRVTGHVVRLTERDVALELSARERIPLKRIMMEQRLLIQKGHLNARGEPSSNAS
jgi:CRP-like cAMP-binding protein